MRKLFLIMLVLMPYFSMGQIVVPMEKEEGGTYLIPCKVNDVPMKFIFDTGASVVNISMTEALFLIKNGHIQKTDIKGVTYAQIANGDIIENTEIILRKIEIGGLVLQNVKASVSHNMTAPLLLGQSAIQKLGTIQLEGNKLIIKNGQEFGSDETAKQYFNKGFQQIEAEKYEEAIRSSETGLKYTKKGKLRALLYDNMAAGYFNLNMLDKAIECCNKGLEEDMYNSQLSYNLGYFLYTNGNKQQALKAFQKFVEKLPSFKDIHKEVKSAGYYYLGELQAENGEFANAETNLLNSIQVVPNQGAYLLLADIYASQQNYIKAVTNYERGISFEPNRLSNIKRYYQLGYCYINTEEYDKAINTFNKCIDCFKSNKEIIIKAHDSKMEGASDFIYFSAMSYLELGRLYPQKGNWEQSISSYEMVYNLAKSILKVQDYVTMVYGYSQLGENEKTIEIIDSGLVVFKDNPDLLFAKTMVHSEDHENNILILKTILKQEKRYQPRIFDYATVYNNIAWSYYKLGSIKEAIPYAEKATTLNSSDANNWETLGEIQYWLRDYAGCVYSMTKSLELVPNNKNALELRGKSYLELGKKKEAKRDLNQIGL